MMNLHKNHISCLFNDKFSTPRNSGYDMLYQIKVYVIGSSLKVSESKELHINKNEVSEVFPNFSNETSWVSRLH